MRNIFLNQSKPNRFICKYGTKKNFKETPSSRVLRFPKHICNDASIIQPNIVNFYLILCKKKERFSFNSLELNWLLKADVIMNKNMNIVHLTDGWIDDSAIWWTIILERNGWMFLFMTKYTMKWKKRRSWKTKKKHEKEMKLSSYSLELPSSMILWHIRGHPTKRICSAPSLSSVEKCYVEWNEKEMKIIKSSENFHIYLENFHLMTRDFTSLH